MAELPKRIAALTLAAVFLITTIGFSAVIIWQVSSQDKNNASETPNLVGEGLKGTKLKDFTPINNIEKLETVDIKKGTGKTAKAGSKVSVYYIGALASDGTVFDSTSDTSDSPITSFSLSQVIEGWQKGIPGMKIGGTRRLLIPANLAYGQNPPPGSGIPSNAALVFDVTLLVIEK